jgi:hypothetical protein
LEVEAGRLDSFKALCAAQKLSPEAAQALIDWQVADHTAENAAVDQQIAETSKAWHDSIRNDAELGGKNYAATEAACNRVVGKFFTPELKQLFNDSGLGNHPEVVRVFARIGAGLAEDRSIAPSAPAATQRRGLFDRSLA